MIEKNNFTEHELVSDTPSFGKSFLPKFSENLKPKEIDNFLKADIPLKTKIEEVGTGLKEKVNEIMESDSMKSLSDLARDLGKELLDHGKDKLLESFSTSSNKDDSNQTKDP